jgi:uncharacterized protein (TIGR04141 family)
MKLNIYLFKKDVQKFENCLKPKTKSRKYDMLQTIKTVENIEYQICVVKGEEKKPKWLAFIEDYVQPTDINDIINRTCSMVILFKIQTNDGQRLFALCNGFGYHIIDKGKTEPNFGLITTLNCIDYTKVKSADTRSLGVQTLQKREASNQYTDLGEFGFEFDSELLQTISGALSDKTIGTKMGGSDNLLLSTSAPVPLDEISFKCLTVYEKFKLDEYKKNFDFIDHVKHEKDPNIIALLDVMLVDAVNQRRNDLKISVVYPDQIEYEKAEVFQFSGLRKPRSETPDVTLESIYDYLGNDAVDLTVLKEKVKVIGLDSADEPVTEQQPLYAYFVFETVLNGNRYILSNKKWYLIENDYLQKIENDLKSIIIPLTDPTLKGWPKDLGEGKYNEQYSNDPDYLLLDKQNFSGKHFGHSKIEIADLFHEPTKKLFFVKKLNRSATLSHLFSQATVSADFFKESEEYQKNFIDELKGKWANKESQFTNEYLKSLTFVYTVGVYRNGNLPDVLPVFSKINLLRHLKLLRKFGYKTEVAKVDIA